MSGSAARRLARAARADARRQGDRSELRTAEVAAVYPDVGVLDMVVSGPDGTTVLVEGVPYSKGTTPQPGRQVSYLMNGAEPFVLSETGPIHDPIFTGRVVANSFHAIEGANLLTPLAADGDAWSAWYTEEVMDVNVDGHLEVTIPSSTDVELHSPLVDVPQAGRHYTGYVTMSSGSANDRAYVEMIAYDADHEVVAQWGSYVDDVKVADTTLKRYPTPDADAELPDGTASIEMIVHVASGSAGTLTIESAFIGTSPVVEGGALLLDRTRIDQSQLSVDGENVLAPWLTEEYDGPTGLGYFELAGNNWFVRHRRVGKIAFVELRGTFAGAPTFPAFGEDLDLDLPYVAASPAVIPGVLLDNGTRYYPVTAMVSAGKNTIERIVHAGSGNGGKVNATNPFTIASGDTIGFAGSYEVD